MATIFEDDFNSYDDGDLDGQGGWVRNATYGVLNVQGTTVKEGAKAVANAAATYAEYRKSGDNIATGRITFYFRVTSNGSIHFRVNESGTGKIFIQVLKGSGKIQYWNGSAYVDIQAIAYDTWICVEIEWRSSDHKARYRIDEGEWTGWDSCVGSWTALNGIAIWHYAGVSTPANVTFFDYIAEYPYAPPPPLAISGLVTLSGNPVEGAKVFLINDDENKIEETKETDSAGSYSFEVSAGVTYHVAVQYDDGEGKKYNAKSKPFLKQEAE